VIADELRIALKSETANIIRIGDLFVEAKRKVKRGRWIPWLEQEFSMSDRTAQKYMKAAKFVAKYELGSDLNLSPSALYLLSEDASWRAFSKEERERITAAVLEAAASERIEQERAQEIIDQILEEIAAADTAKREALCAKQEADRTRRLAWESKNPQLAKKKARERFIRDAMREEMDEAKEQSREKGETWSEVKDEWVEKWGKDNWHPTREAEFEAHWAAYWRDNHGPTAQEKEEAEAAKAKPDAEAKEAEAAKAKPDAEAKEAEAAKAKADAEAEAEAERVRANARARFHNRRAFGGDTEKKIHSGPRELLVKTLGMLGSDNAGQRDAAALAAEKQRAKLGMMWGELIIRAVDMKTMPDE
jgi:chemotaxis protein histidine kinase CheA